jgi:hypothetical protein
MSAFNELGNKLGPHFHRELLLECLQCHVLNLSDFDPEGIPSDIGHSRLPLGIDDGPDYLGEVILQDSSLIDLYAVVESAEESAELVIVWHLEEAKLSHFYEVLLDTLKPRIEGCGL